MRSTILHVAIICLVTTSLVTTNSASGQDFEWSDVDGGFWTTGSSWLGGIAPSGTVGNILIRPDFGGAISNTPTTITVNNLTIGADLGRGTLLLSSSAASLFVANGLVTIESGGALSNSSPGTLVGTGGIVNNGTFTSSSVSLSVLGGTFTNTGLLTGSARIFVPVTNSGRIEQLNSGQLEFSETVTNQAAGLIAARNADLFFRGGLTNQGALSFGQDGANGFDLFGDIDNTGTIGLSSGTEMSFVGNLVQNGTLNLVGGSRLIVFGDFSGTGGTVGPGTLEVLGTLTLGNSPAEVSFGGDVSLGDGTLVELGGLNAGQFDALNAMGAVSIAGTLEVSLLGGFTPSAGNVFDIFTAAGGIQGTFNDEILPQLDPGLFWNVDQGATVLTLSVIDYILGDMTGDGLVNLDDAPAFIQALVNRTAYNAAYPLVNEESAGDIDGSGTFDLGDIGLFSGLFGGPASASAQAVPEPTTISLAFVLLIGIAIRQRRRV